MGRSRAPGSSGGPANRSRERSRRSRRTAPLHVRPAPKIPMSQDARRELVDALRYVTVDLLDSGRGRWAAALVFFATWGSLAVWFPGWGVLLGWIPAALLAIHVGYFCR